MDEFMIRGWDPIIPVEMALLSSSSRSAPANQRSAGGVRVSTPCGAVSTRGVAVFVSGWPELMYGGIYEPGMGIYPPRVRRDRGFPRGATLAARPSSPIGRGRPGGSARPMGLGLGKRWGESHLPIILYYQIKNTKLQR